jgi:hypothetical protein
MDTTTPPAATPPAPTDEDKTVAIVSYLTLIGFIVAIVLHSSKKTKLGAYHLRQVLGFMLTGVAGWIAVAIITFILALVLSFVKFLLAILIPLIWLAFTGAMIALWVMGLIAAVNGQMKPMPVVGPLYQQWFGTAFD